MSFLFEFNIDNEHVDKVAVYLKSKSKDLRSYTNLLPEIKCCKELINKKISEDDIVRYIFYVTVNDWSLTNVYYQNYRGSEALWNCVRDSLLELRKFNIEDLTKNVLSKLRGDESRLKLFKVSAKILEVNDLSRLIDDIVRRKEVPLDLLSKTLKEVCRNHSGEVFRKYYGRLSTRRMPIDKVVNLIARTCSRALNYSIRSRYGEQSIMYDVHVAKVTLRLGLVKPISRSFTRYFGIGFPLFGAEELKEAVIKAWRLSLRKVMYMYGISMLCYG